VSPPPDRGVRGVLPPALFLGIFMAHIIGRKRIIYTMLHVTENCEI